MKGGIVGVAFLMMLFIMAVPPKLEAQKSLEDLNVKCAVFFTYLIRSGQWDQFLKETRPAYFSFLQIITLVSEKYPSENINGKPGLNNYIMLKELDAISIERTRPNWPEMLEERLGLCTYHVKNLLGYKLITEEEFQEIHRDLNRELEDLVNKLEN